MSYRLRLPARYRKHHLAAIEARILLVLKTDARTDGYRFHQSEMQT
jgi:hypothetical protein